MAGDVICEKIGSCGLITLNRPQALNALTLNMVRAISTALGDFESDTGVACVAIRGAGGKAFCAGGDIKTLYDLGKAGDYAGQLDFWREEYRLNLRIKFYPKPYLALTTGIVMGGGAGLSLHGSHVVAGENFTFAMPETGIGFFPDVGATFFLPRLPARAGMYLAVTGARMSCGDAIAFNIAGVHIPSARHGALIERLARGEPIEEAIAAEHSPPPASALERHWNLIARCFAGPRLSDILRSLDEEAGAGSQFAGLAASAISSKCPASLAIVLRQMRIGAAMDLAEALQTEFRIAARLARRNDYYEGVRAVIIDKGHRPRWDPAAIEEVDALDTSSYFAPLPEGELGFGASAEAAVRKT
ncbi:MAG: enoyl-CoA hydratase/isomerase family protein [Methylocapsa sp.]|nr:enoyl-CoA hydratase/isomerase family protein [Methylocapsa sp.]